MRKRSALLHIAIATAPLGVSRFAAARHFIRGLRAPAQHHALLADHLGLDAGVLQQRLQRRQRRQAGTQRMAAAPSGKVTRIHHRPPADDTESLDGQLQRLRRDVVGMNTVLCGGREGQQQPCGDGHPPSSDRMVSIQPPDVEHMTLGSDSSCSARAARPEPRPARPASGFP
ncbi:hypothetical protein G6F62_013797 [Rhizopus arrhizus]|nr:hypothetical protein G6F62_013797 [Rhizopus arrhizus]